MTAGNDDPTLPPPAPTALLQKVAIAAREAGLDDDGRHALAALVTDGRTSSSRELARPEADQALLVADLVAGGHAQLIADGPYGAPVLLRPDGTPIDVPLNIAATREWLERTVAAASETTS